MFPQSNPAIPQFSLRVSRSLMRKLRRMERMNPAAFSGKHLPKPDGLERMSHAQYVEYCIRVHGWNRVRAYRLGATRRERKSRIFTELNLQGASASMVKISICNAPIKPD